MQVQRGTCAGEGVQRAGPQHGHNHTIREGRSGLEVLLGPANSLSAAMTLPTGTSASPQKMLPLTYPGWRGGDRAPCSPSLSTVPAAISTLVPLVRVQRAKEGMMAPGQKHKGQQEG